MTTVILAEKPNQAQIYAEAMQHSKKGRGFYEVQDELFSGTTFITHALGHLVDLFMPGQYDPKLKKWDMTNLPIFPEPMRYYVTPSNQEQFQIVNDLLSKATTIIIATDCDREGELIAREILNQMKLSFEGKDVRRLWINSLEKEAIREGFRNLWHAGHTYFKYIEAQTRQKSDWLIGMNFTPLYSLLLQEHGSFSRYPIGRVQTPTLMMVYKREKEIKNFKPRKIYELFYENKMDEQKIIAKIKNPPQFDTKEEVYAYLNEKNMKIGIAAATVTNIEEKEVKHASPLLFSLSDLQILMNKKYKYSPKETLQGVQKLYEKRWLTYPRTDCTFITQKEFAYLKANLQAYKAFAQIEVYMPCLVPNYRYVDDDEVREHHAIIPTRVMPSTEEFNKLTLLEKQIYNWVLHITVAMFAPPMLTKEATMSLRIGELLFEAKERTLMDLGWKKVIVGNNQKENHSKQSIANYQVGQTINGFLGGLEKEKKAPSPYTEGALIHAMKNAGKKAGQSKEISLKVMGIGTEATRADVLEKLKNQDYLDMKNNKLFVTEKGKELGRVIERDPLLSNIDLTASLETALHSVGEGLTSQEEFLDNLKELIQKYIQKKPHEIKVMADTEEWQQELQKTRQALSLGKCPKCGQEVMDRNSYIGCSSNLENCDFRISKVICKKKLSNKNLSDLLKTGRTQFLKGWVGKSGKKFNAALSLKNGDLNFVFSPPISREKA
ncbi:topoisomerase C-terminal repeat-containing protein [Listeria monocytogenes]|uniref:type IA DNA topoisomerase n=1 Tax=Listeria monocytogenes TaxID=1639 RepID=UPI001EDF756A|nr:type IA DNA topoisomerase [Listeria monocytogenes]MCG3315163.1 topoisomerase C-terminal repeat-containing protein [Listeria monocytogenes]MCH5071819.1 topoisomerase C-terminal repeat-containing protein [Listeria monocytogenes]